MTNKITNDVTILKICMRMRAIRIEHNLTAEKLSTKLGTNKNSLTAVERGEHLPSIILLLKFCEYFEIDMNYLCCFTDEPIDPHEI